MKKNDIDPEAMFMLNIIIVVVSTILAAIVFAICPFGPPVAILLIGCIVCGNLLLICHRTLVWKQDKRRRHND